jgi:hypothetical protein
MRRAPKLGRLASKDERERAAGLVALYRAAQQVGGRLVIDEPGRHVRFDADPEVLLLALEHFAAGGTFARIDDGEVYMVKAVSAAAGKRYEDKLAAIEGAFAVSESTAKRMLRDASRSKRDAD